MVTAPPLFDAHGVLAGWGEENTAQMVVFGGRCIEQDEYGVHEACLNDTHILDLTSMRWLSTSLNPAEYQHPVAAQPGLQPPQQRSVYQTSSENDKVSNFGSVDSGHGSMEPSRLAASLATLTPGDMSFQAAQFSQTRREVSLDAPVMKKGVGVKKE